MWCLKMDKITILFSALCLIIATNGLVADSVQKPSTNCKHYHAMDFLMCLSYCTEYQDKCEAYPDAVCKTRIGKCSACEVYFEHNGKEVECNPRKKIQECPPDRPPVECVDPCKATVCRPYKTAQCRFDNCGGCNLEYYNGKSWMPCPETINPLGSVHATHKTVCPNGKTPLTCTSYTCDQSRCPNHPSAKCIPDSCDNCRAEYFIFGRNHDAIKVDCASSACPIDAMEVSCPKDLCNFMPCPNYPEARCVVDNCTQCHVDFVLPNGHVLDKDQCFNRPACPTQRDSTCHKGVCRASFCPGDMAIWCR
ncbi:hypothetical protein KUTeg_010818 [Tegillarca granosa]|uniref:Uncharacterized protein n=1 Tax=Tegillarca granosa TaxID=220873 RepID=A0ABQ9F241_TEGGR|nr:hypothetical protein KUTeg_010818 [Tegillarca granosa]